MAEVVVSSSSHSSAGAGVAAASFNSSPSSVVPQTRPSNSHPSLSQNHLHHHHHQQPPLPAQYTPTASVSDDGSATFFSHHQRLSSGESIHLSSSSEHSVPRGLPPMVSTMAGSVPAGVAPLSPRAISLGLGDQQLEGLAGDPTAPRKRSKVSRACDECRRKKIRCDATSESGIEQCSSCKRVGSRCSFSRVPMKRGPSKGYIKELADRLNTLENSISTGDLHPYGAPGDSENSPGPSDSTSPPPPLGPVSGQKQPRKRTLSSSSDFQSSVHLQPLSSTAPRPAERLPPIDTFHPANQHQRQQRSQHLQHEAQRQLPHPQSNPQHQPSPPHPQSSISVDVPSSLYKASLSPEGSNQYWPSYADVGGRRGSVSFPYDSGDPQRLSVGSISTDITMSEWDEEAVDQYYALIHPTFPLLPFSKGRLRHRLESAPASIRSALLEALYSTVRSNPSSTMRTTRLPNPQRASELVITSQFDGAPTASILHLQTMILMVLEADNHGPATMRGQQGPQRSVWLGAAVGLAYNLRLHHSSRSREKSNGDLDSDESLGRRAWWILVVLDRWHAISTSSPLLIPDSSVVLLPEDQTLLGFIPFQIARLSCIVGHLAEAFTNGDEALSAASVNPYISKLLRGELERFRESVEVVWGSLNLLHLAYYHVKLLTLRHNSASEPRHLLEPAHRMAAMLDHSLTPITPLNHHFAALALVTLVDLTEIPETRDEAWKGIQQLAEALEMRRGVATREDSIGWDRALKDLIIKRTKTRHAKLVGSGSGPSEFLPGHGSLQHLAELAIGNHSPSSSSGYPTKATAGLDTEKLQRYGYLGSILL